MLLEGKRALIFGVANNKSIAYGIAKEFKAQGARLAFNYLGDALLKRVEPISEELGGDFIFQCDVTSDEEIAASVERVKKEWGGVDILIHSIGFANREDLQGRFIETSRDGFKLALDISAYSLTALANAYEDLLTENASVITLSYYGAEKVITNYNVMGVAKAALEASVRYLAVDLGAKGVRINGISAGPIKTLAASGISGFRSILNYIEEQAPLRRNVTIEDVGRSAVYLASDLSSGVTGEILHVDSGYNVMGIGL
ncbi:enoyl-ACP reductase [Desulfovibrio mangrovi]|uniref:enoyl-ACP reductase FabI n=1 Tax=Desulfovibrio mangrovi TaxID=2976983 RepID=UPI002247D686|nr:enoyl-ACP reductase [Desulfovibrio mangrovi]UZP65883.1 enoyl-ACP reductase [Desulfovibrio mangrovi]